MTVTVAGTSISSPIDSSGAFALRGVPVGTAQLQFSANGTNTQLELDNIIEHQDIHLTIVLSGTTAQVEDDDREAPDNSVEIEGRLTAISGTTLQVSGKDVSVPAGIPIRHGGTALTFADLHVGDRIHIRGTKNGATIVATSIEDQTSNPAAPVPAPNGGNEAEVNGTIAAKTGNCPALTFSIGATSVGTNTSTQFKNVSCSALANGVRVQVKGTRQSNGSVVALSVEQKN